MPRATEPRLSPTVTPRSVPEPEAIDAFPSPAGEPKFKRVVSKRLRLSIPLPNRSGWKLKREKSMFVVLEHAATSSKLLVALWREDELMNRQRCEERARLLRDLPQRADVLSTRLLPVPKEFDTQVDVGFDTAGEAAPLHGYALAFGGLARECFAFVYTTMASGEGRERIVGDRLAVMQTVALEGVERRPGGVIGREPNAVE